MVAARKWLSLVDRVQGSEAEPGQQRVYLARAGPGIDFRRERQASSSPQCRLMMQWVEAMEVVGSRTVASSGIAASSQTSSALT
jgi:hypothetical protein